MSEQSLSDSASESDTTPRCPWCSAALASADDAICPSCNATLREDVAKEVPGVTSVDHEAILRSRKPVARSTGVMGWLSGNYQENPESTAEQITISPPDADVKREMLRMELAAIGAKLDAQRGELEAERGVTAAAVEPVQSADPIEDDAFEADVPPPA